RKELLLNNMAVIALQTHVLLCIKNYSQFNSQQFLNLLILESCKSCSDFSPLQGTATTPMAT
ncbi:MAG: hypothetical protein LBR26_05670, partial [Prevotella sp.]|nr:hypothetical protein [Prevotella sp.]